MKDDDINDPGPTPGPDDASTLPLASEASLHRKIGPYRLLERIGQGGMGEVYLAEQVSPIRRRVAIKLIKVGMDTREVIARFESERQALAMMDHPNVARIYDAGSTDAGRPYFAMEYVPGEPITEYCDRNKLDLRSRLELFIPVCQAIHHAHQTGIIHRDIKPSNVLVTIQDSRPTPKVIDFGVAKATQQSLTEKTIYTAQGRLIGTPAYMSPEQAEMTGLNLDATSDVYSLGVLLYELLAGALPFDTKALMDAGVAEVHRIIRDVEPPRPSTKISTLGERAAEIASRRRVEMRSWQRQLHGELDWITMHAMEKDRARRYLSAAAFGEDVGRFLRGEVVVARPQSVFYRVAKSVKRHRRIVVAATLPALVVSLAVVAFVSRENRSDSLEEIRAILETSIVNSGITPESQPDWAKLKQILYADVEAHPRGQLAILAMRCGISIEVALPGFGLMSEMPMFKLGGAESRFECGRDYLAFVDIESSWDGMPWRHIVSARISHVAFANGRGSFGGAYPLDEILAGTPLKLGPHRLDLRAHLTIYDATRSSEFWPSGGSHQETRQIYWQTQPWQRPPLDPLWEGDLPIADQEIALYEQYPPEFPFAMEGHHVADVVEEWFRPEEICLYRVRLPPGSDGYYCVSTPGSCTLSNVAPPSVVASGAFVGVVQFVFRVGEDLFPAFPIAGVISLSIPESGTIAKFDFAVGPATFSIFGAYAQCSEGRPLDNGRLLSIAAIVPDASDPRTTPYFISTLPDDGNYRGQLELSPSREVALATNEFHHYSGIRMTRPISVRVITISGERETQ